MKKTALLASTMLLLLPCFDSASAQPPADSDAAAAPTIPLARLVSIVAEKSGDTFIVDPRVRADVTLIGEDSAEIDYGDLLEILRVHGFVAVRSGGDVLIVPDANVRSLPLPLVSDAQERPDAEYVSRVITVRNVPAAGLVPVLRPLMPQQAHLAAYVCSNTLVLADTAGNIERLEQIIAAMDTGDAYEPSGCDPSSATPQGERAPQEDSAPQEETRRRR